MAVKTNPYATNSQRVTRNMKRIASTHKSFFDALNWEKLFDFLLNLPMAARYASMDIMMHLMAKSKKI